MKKKLPKYLELANKYRQLIEKGVYSPGDSIPDERTLSRENNLDRRTVRRAFDILQQDGLVHKVVGSGTYIGGKNDCLPNRRINNLSSYPIIGVAVPETAEHDVLRTWENAAIKNIFNYKYEALRINYISQAELKSRLIHYHDFLKGIVFLRQNYSLISANVQYAISCKIPTVVAGIEVKSQINEIPCDNLFIDEEEGGKEIADYFISGSHHQIAFIGKHVLKLKKHGRYIGFMNVMQKRGLKPIIINEKKLKISDYGYASVPFQQACGAQIAQNIMSKRKPPTAVICENDIIALGFLEQLKKMKISCPRDVEVFGFGDNIIWSEQYLNSSINPLSTAGVDHNKVGKLAIDMLLYRIANPNTGKRIKSLKTTVIHRQTTKAG